jgi:hypothetical protein
MKQKKEIIYLKVKVKITHDEDDPKSRISAVKTACDITTSTSVMGYPVSVNPVEVKEISKPIIIKEKIENSQPLIGDHSFF